MRVLLVVPPYRTTDVLVSQLYPMPLAAVSLAAVLRDAGVDVAVKDFLLPAKASKCTAPPSFAGKHAPPYQHFGTPLRECLQWLDRHAREYDAVGLHMGQCNVWEAGVAIAAHVRKLGIPLVVGGPFATTAPAQVQEMTQSNVLVRGEGEGVVVRAFQRAAKGKRLVLEGTPVDLAAQPLPAWDLAPPSDYPRFNGKVRGVLTISRGCPWQCTFCSVHTVMGRKHRRLPPDRVRDQIMALWDHGVRYFCFLDDNLFMSQRAADQLLGVLADLRASVRGFNAARFYVEEGIEVRVAAKPGLLGRLAAAGFDHLALGLETTNDAQRQASRKPYSDQDLHAALAEAAGAGVTPKAFYIVGFPGDSVASVCADLVQFGKLGMAARPNNLKLYPGTEATQRFLDAGLIGADYDWRLSSFWTPPTGAGLDYLGVRKLKTVLGAIGFAADTFGVRVYADPLEEVLAKVNAARGYTLEHEGGKLTLRGNMFRPTPYRHMLEQVLLASGAAGARSQMVGKKQITCAALPRPADEIQAAIVHALRGKDDPVAAQPVRGAVEPQWIVGDSAKVLRGRRAPGKADLIFTCPPYFDLEQYSDDPADISNMDPKEFVQAYHGIIAQAVARLLQDRFAVVVVGEVRGRDGFYLGLVQATVEAFEKAGARYYGEAILVTPVGSLPVRCGPPFEKARKLGKAHQNVLVFCKGDPVQAAQAIGSVSYEAGQVEGLDVEATEEA